MQADEECYRLLRRISYEEMFDIRLDAMFRRKYVPYKENNWTYQEFHLELHRRDFKKW